MPDTLDIIGASQELKLNSLDLPRFADTTNITGFSLEFAQSPADLIVPDTTEIMGFGLEFLDYPAYVVPISQRRWLS